MSDSTFPSQRSSSFVPGDMREGIMARGLFDDVAIYYDRINSLFSLGTGRWYRRRMLRRAGLQPGQTVLDVAIGTGLIAREEVAIIGAEHVIGVDVSWGMLQQCQRALPISLVQGDVMSLPFGDESIDFLSLGYALRLMEDLTQTFAACRRVLKPGGRILVLEIGRAESRLLHKLLHIYLGRVVPFLSGQAAYRASRGLMNYYWDTLESCVFRHDVIAAMERAGFHNIRCEVSCGVFHAYMGCV